MRKQLLASASAAALVFGLATGAMADSSAVATANNTATSPTVSSNTSNDPGQTRENLLDMQMNQGSAGIAHQQQNNGDNNILNAATAALGQTVQGDLTAEAKTRAETSGNTVSASGDGSLSDPDRSNAITSSFNDEFSGQATVQQNNGDANDIEAATAVVGSAGNSVGDVTQTANAVARTGEQSGAGDDQNADTLDDPVVDNGSARTNTINPSFNSFSGEATVQQNNGSANAMSASTAVTGLAGSGISGDVTQTINEGGSPNARTYGHDAETTTGQRDNEIANSFDSAGGVATVQQNNGDLNAISSSTAVAGSENAGTIGDLGGAGSGPSVYQDVNVDENKVGGSNNPVATQDNLDVRDSSGGQTFGSNGSTRTNTLADSFDEAGGVASVQQNNGNINTVSAGTAVAAVGEAKVAKQGIDLNNNSVENAQTDAIGQSTNPPNRGNTISGSFQSFSGVATVQQNNGDVNSLNAGTAVLTASGADDVTQNIGVVGSVGNSNLDDGLSPDTGTQRMNTLEGSTANSSSDGILTIQQNNGDGNVLGAGTGVVVNTEGTATNETTQNITANGTVSGNTVSHDDESDAPIGKRDNTISNSFKSGGSGVATIQQNNGNGNVMSAGTGVVVDRGNSARFGTEPVVTQATSTTGTVENNSAEQDDASGANGFTRENTIDQNAFQSYDGVASIQQNNGDNNAVLASTSVRVNENNSQDDLDNVGSDDSPATASTTGTVHNNDSGIGSSGNINDTDRNNAIDRMGYQANGVFSVQQNNGDNNVLGVAQGVTVNREGTPTQSQGQEAADLAATGNATVTDNFQGPAPNTTRSNSIGTDSTGVFNDATGIITTQQNNGDNNVMGAATQSATNTSSDGFVDAVATSELSATVTGNQTQLAMDTTGGTGAAARTNTVQGSFNNVSGEVTVQQNNGSNNAIQSAITVTANIN